MNEVFDIRKFDEYREDNRREVKKAKGGLPHSLWDTYSSMANCYGGSSYLALWKIRMEALLLPDYRMPQS